MSQPQMPIKITEIKSTDDANMAYLRVAILDGYTAPPMDAEEKTFDDMVDLLCLIGFDKDTARKMFTVTYNRMLDLDETTIYYSKEEQCWALVNNHHTIVYVLEVPTIH